MTLQSDTVTFPAAASALTLISAEAVTGPYLDAIGQSVNLGTKTITVPESDALQFYRIRSGTDVSITSVTVSGGNVVITYN